MSKATTKMAIAFAFKELLLEKSLEKITVNDITEKCAMNRQTFYYHFHDILELTEWICEEDAERALKENRTYDTWQNGFLSIFNMIKRDKAFIINIYHNVPKDYLYRYCNTTTCFMPYINAFFQPRKKEDRPLVVPKGAVNFAFLGQFAETPRDTIFTTEYSIRTGMESVYTLMNIDRGVPEVWASQYDIRELLRAAYYALDKKTINEVPLSFKEKLLLKTVLNAVKGTDVELLLKESGLIN